MGLFGPYTYKKKNKEKFFLHFKDKGKTRIYYFSKDPVGAMSGVPKGYEAFESERTGIPMLRKIQKKQSKSV